MKVAHLTHWKDISNKQKYFLTCPFLSISRTVLTAVGRVLSGVSYLQSTLCKVKKKIGKSLIFSRVDPMTVSYICFSVKDVFLSLNFPVATLMFATIPLLTHTICTSWLYVWDCICAYILSAGPLSYPSGRCPVSSGSSSTEGVLKKSHISMIICLTELASFWWSDQTALSMKQWVHS